MALGKLPDGGDDAEEASDGIFAEINITPLTDVFLVMVVIFMVTALAEVENTRKQQADTKKEAEQSETEKKSGLKVNLPSGKAQDIDTSKASLVLTIPTQGDIDIGGKTIPDAQMDQVFAAAFAREALEIARRNSGEATAPTAVALRVLGTIEEVKGDAADAETHFRAAYDLGEKLHAQSISSSAEWKIPLADFLVGKNRCGEALPLLRGARTDLEAEHSDDAIAASMISLLLHACDGTRGSADDRAAVDALRKIPAVEKEMYPTAESLLNSAHR